MTEKDETLFNISLFAPMFIGTFLGICYQNIAIGVLGFVIGITIAKLELVVGFVKDDRVIS